MDYLHYKVSVRQGEVIRVTLDEKTDTSQANIRLLDTLNYFKYSAGKKCAETRGRLQAVPSETYTALQGTVARGG